MALRKEPPLFRCRASALGQLMTPARSKSGLSQTALSMITLWYKEQLYSRKKEVVSKYMTKGNNCEDASIAYLNELYGTNYVKNEQFYNNDHIHGTPDILTYDTVIDIKNSWDFSTFPLFSTTCPNRDYQWQVQGYMMLTGLRKGAVVYTLMDLPDEQIEQEYRRSGGSGLVPSQFKRQYRYSDVPTELRVKRFNFEYDEENDRVICPEGNELTWRSVSFKRESVKYQADKKICNACKCVSMCTKSKNGRSIERSFNQSIREKLEAQYKEPGNQEIYRLRKEKVELPFAHIKKNLKLDAFLLRGKQKVLGEYSIFAACFNITRMINYFGIKEFREKMKALAV